MLNAVIIDPSKVRDISPLLLDEQKQLKVVPARVFQETTMQERALFGVRNAYYGFLTTELIAYLKDFIGDRSAIEIGAGHGGLGRALGIPATDSHQQDRPEIKAYYNALQQPVITYGEDVEMLDAHSAVEKYKPQVVVASWVTHRYTEARASAGGNQDGVNEEAIIDACEAYVFIGNEKVHAAKSIWQRPHEKFSPYWVFSRAANGTADFIAIWRKPSGAPKPARG